MLCMIRDAALSNVNEYLRLSKKANELLDCTLLSGILYLSDENF